MKQPPPPTLVVSVEERVPICDADGSRGDFTFFPPHVRPSRPPPPND